MASAKGIIWPGMDGGGKVGGDDERGAGHPPPDGQLMTAEELKAEYLRHFKADRRDRIWSLPISVYDGLTAQEMVDAGRGEELLEGLRRTLDWSGAA